MFASVPDYTKMNNYNLQRKYRYLPSLIQYFVFELPIRFPFELSISNEVSYGKLQPLILSERIFHLFDEQMGIICSFLIVYP